MFIATISRAKANIGDAMNKFFMELGGASKSNSPYASQSAGYYTGGSLNTRLPVIQERPFNIQAPYLTSGCGGIDMFTGSFSHINVDQFVAQLKAIGANAIGYAFQLGIQTLSPQIASTLSKLQEVIDSTNRINISSCENAKLLVDGVLGKSLTTKESMCAQMALINGSASDADAAKNKCKTAAAQTTENNKLNPEQQFTDINITWQALKKDGYLDLLGQETSEAIMSMVGTIIYKNNSDPQFVAPSILNEDYLNSLLEGGEVKILKCDDSIRCLNVMLAHTNLSRDRAYRSKIKALLQSIQDKLKFSSVNSNQILSDEELALINQVTIPLFRIMVNTATGESPLDINILSDLVSKNLLYTFLEGISISVRRQFMFMNFVNNSHENTIKHLIKNIDLIHAYLDKHLARTNASFRQFYEIVDLNQRLDRDLAADHANRLRSILGFERYFIN